MMNKVLKMQFETQKGSKSTISIPDPKASLSESTIKSAMLTLIEKDIFKTKQGSLVSPVNAKVVETTEVVYDFA